MTEKLIVFVEEPSAEKALEILLPSLLGNTELQISKFQCKQQMLIELPKRLRAYSKWLPESTKIIVLVDRDRDDCQDLKKKLEKFAADSGLVSKTQGRNFQVVNRIAIEELEAWYFGDWEAVRSAFPRLSEDWNRKAGFRNPDEILGGTWERLEAILQKAGYYSGGLRKVELASLVAPHMMPDRNCSPSFQVFLRGIRSALGESA